MNNRIIITGAPGTGKTTLIEKLKQRNFDCKSEAARRVINVNIKLENTILPWKNRRAFDSEVLLEMLFDYFNVKHENYTFFDGGLPDILAYEEFLSVNNIKFHKVVPQFSYNKIVVILEPWESIYVRDEIRPWTFEQVKQIHESIINIYNRLGYEIFLLDKKSPAERTRILIEKLKK